MVDFAVYRAPNTVPQGHAGPLSGRSRAWALVGFSGREREGCDIVLDHGGVIGGGLRAPLGACPVFRSRHPGPGRGQPMMDVLLALVVAVAAYLVYAILYPERF